MMLFLAPECSSWFQCILGVEVDDARDDSWRGSFMVWLYLTAEPSHVGINVDGLGYPLHCPTIHSCPMRGHDLPPSAILS
jgi:hypothetical protein